MMCQWVVRTGDQSDGFIAVIKNIESSVSEHATIVLQNNVHCGSFTVPQNQMSKKLHRDDYSLNARASAPYTYFHLPSIRIL